MKKTPSVVSIASAPNWWAVICDKKTKRERKGEAYPLACWALFADGTISGMIAPDGEIVPAEIADDDSSYTVFEHREDDSRPSPP